MKVLALTVGAPTTASTQYRLAQFVDSLKAEGVSLHLTDAKSFRAYRELDQYDVVIVQKRLMPKSWVKRIRKNAKNLIFDVDDAIWEPHGRKHSWWARYRSAIRLDAILSASDVCTLPNMHLAQALESKVKRVMLVPMALDENQWMPLPARRDGPIRIGWAGAPPNLVYLAQLEEVMGEVQSMRNEIEWVIYCGEPPRLSHDLNTTYIPFCAGSEISVVQNFDIGLLPLPDNRFAAGKSPIKALQYAACGVPCIASPVGATQETVIAGVTGLTAVTQDEWKAALLSLIDDAELRQTMGAAARRQFMRHHSQKVVQSLILECWRGLVHEASAEKHIVSRF